MKSKEEIEQLAENYLNINLPKNGYNGYIDSYTKGYTQCQEDIRKDWQNYTISEKSDFIEFLNKKD